MIVSVYENVYRKCYSNKEQIFSSTINYIRHDYVFNSGKILLLLQSMKLFHLYLFTLISSEKLLITFYKM